MQSKCDTHAQCESCVKRARAYIVGGLAPCKVKLSRMGFTDTEQDLMDMYEWV